MITSAQTVVQQTLQTIAAGDSLTEEAAAALFAVIMRGEATPTQIAAVLMGLRARGESPAELAGAVRALRSAMIRVPADVAGAVDTCGTGGGAVNTFNISTTAAFVATGAGVPVAKHGNRSFTSRSGSADVLEALGVGVSLSPERAAHVFDAVGIVFLFAPEYHPAMRHVAPVRRDLGVPTLMNLVGPLANPASVTRQVIGVAERARAPMVAEALLRLGAEHALVVHGDVGMDEISPVGTTSVWEVRDGAVTAWSIDPMKLGLPVVSLEGLSGGTPEENATRLERLLQGEADEAGRVAVLLTAAAAIYVSGKVETMEQGLDLATASLDRGDALGALEKLRVMTRS